MSGFSTSAGNGQLRRFTAEATATEQTGEGPTRQHRPGFAQGGCDAYARLPSGISGLRGQHLPEAGSNGTSLSLQCADGLRYSHRPKEGRGYGDRPGESCPPAEAGYTALLSCLYQSVLAAYHQPQGAYLGAEAAVRQDDSHDPSFCHRLSLYACHRQREDQV